MEQIKICKLNKIFKKKNSRQVKNVSHVKNLLSDK